MKILFLVVVLEIYFCVDTSAGYDEDNARYSIVVPSYSVVNLFANYNATEQLTLRANVGNVFDKEYWTAAYR